MILFLEVLLTVSNPKEEYTAGYQWADLFTSELSSLSLEAI